MVILLTWPAAFKPVAVLAAHLFKQRLLGGRLLQPQQAIVKTGEMLRALRLEQSTRFGVFDQGPTISNRLRPPMR